MTQGTPFTYTRSIASKLGLPVYNVCQGIVGIATIKGAMTSDGMLWNVIAADGESMSTETSLKECKRYCNTFADKVVSRYEAHRDATHEPATPARKARRDDVIDFSMANGSTVTFTRDLTATDPKLPLWTARRDGEIVGSVTGDGYGTGRMQYTAWNQNGIEIGTYSTAKMARIEVALTIESEDAANAARKPAACACGATKTHAKGMCVKCYNAARRVAKVAA